MAMKITLRINDAHHLDVECCCYNHDRNEIFTGSRDCLIKAWDVESGRQLRIQQQHTNWVMGLVYVAEPVKMLFSCSLDGNILVWNERGRLLQVIEYGGPIYCLAWDAKQKQLLAGGRGAVQVFKVLRPSTNYMQTDPERKSIGYVNFLEFKYCMLAHDDTVQAICCSSKGKVFTTGIDRAICIFESDRPEETAKKVNFVHEGGVVAAAFDTDGNLLVTGAYDGTVSIWSAEGHCLDTFSKITDRVSSIAYIPSTKTYWVTGNQRSIVVIDPIAPALITQWVADTSGFHNLILRKVFHVDGKDVVIGLSDTRDLIVWKFDRFIPHRVLCAHSNWIEALVVAQRRPVKERFLRKDLSNVQPGKKIRPVPADPKTNTIRYNDKGLREDGRGKPMLTPNAVAELEMYTGASDGAILRWVPNTESHKDIWIQSELCKKAACSIVCIMYHQELDLLITGSTDAFIRVWNMDGQQSIPMWRGGDMRAKGPDMLKGHVNAVVGLAACKKLDMTYCSCREELATCGGCNVVKVWNEFSHQTKHILKGDPKEEILMVKWCNSHNGLWVTGGNQGTICTWNPTTLQPINSLNYKNKSITSILLDEFNDTILLCTLHDNSLHMFSLTSLKKIVSFSGHLDQVHAMVYISTRDQYLSSSWDLTLRVWLTLDATTIAALQVSPNASSSSDPKNNNKIEHEEKTPHLTNWNDNSEPFLSQYERKYPNNMPKIQEVNKKQTDSGFLDRLLLFEDEEYKKLTANQARPKSHLGASLHLKIGALEAVLRP